MFAKYNNPVQRYPASTITNSSFSKYVPRYAYMCIINGDTSTHAGGGQNGRLRIYCTVTNHFSKLPRGKESPYVISVIKQPSSLYQLITIRGDRCIVNASSAAALS